jgi:predicted GNAT family acetyltransferase
MLADRVVERLPSLPRRFQLIGARHAVEPFARRFAAAGLAARLERSQIYMALERGQLRAAERLDALRPAAREDYALVYESGARLRAEELEEDPRHADPAGCARRVEEECREGTTFVWIQGGELLFRASLSARPADAVQISGVYTPLGRRNQGLARRGLSELCSRLLEQSRAACLFVNDFNAPALALYRRLGFTRRAAWTSMFYGPRA